ncbi:MAG: hypothetical protein B6227_00605 [Fusobacteriia bacterium 4572_74]|nr:MAG: hypothetical protein B6227_00605 [Fusobacteriia bacterium 4572_74]
MSLFGFKEKRKITELNILIDDLQKEIIKNKTKNDELIKIIQEKDIKIKKTSKSPHDRQFEKITLEFDKIKKQSIDMKILNENLKSENIKLIAENNEKTEKIMGIQKIADNLREENKALKQSEKPKIITGEAKYRVLIKDFYSARKHDEFKKYCEKLGYVYVSELENLNFEKLTEGGISKTKINNAKNEYINFKNGEFNFDMKEYLVYGHRVSKIFFRYRSFVSCMAEKGIEFLYQLENFDFETLEGKNFTPIQINKIKKKIIEYNKLRKK